MQSKPTARERNALLDVLSLCMQISIFTKADCFFEYSPHVNSYSVRIYRNGWKVGTDAELVDLQSKLTDKNMKETCAKLVRIFRQLEVRENV